MKVAIAHFCEGAGHASRLLGIASCLESYSGVDIEIAGGGPGAKFVEMNGFKEYEPTEIDFIGKREEVNDLWAAALNFSNAVSRANDFRKWLKEVDPDVVLTDDPYAFFVSSIRGDKVYRLDHMRSGMFERRLDNFNQFLMERISQLLGEKTFITSLSSEIALDPGQCIVEPTMYRPEDYEEAEDFEILIIPGTFSRGFDRLKEELEERDFNVKMVGDEEWEMVPSMYPYAEAADYVVCTGFSSIAESVVAGTHCIVDPFIEGQEAIANQIEDEDIQGITVCRETDEIIEEIEDGKKETPMYENGSEQVAEKLVKDFRG
jgi:hypothetical protein